MPLNVAVCGCVHGELERLYKTVEAAEKSRKTKVDLILCCGDFEAVRHPHDLESVAVPLKYRFLKTFHKYYSGELKAPVLTVFIGGNHEASSYLWQLPYGGWVAHNMYYMGRASVLNIGGIRIAGLSGIYKKYDYLRGTFEMPPFDEDTKHSIYHVRAVDVFRLKLLRKPVDVLLTHDWPRGIDRFGDREALLQRKPFFRYESDQGELGSLPSFELLKMLTPKYWFAAHMHAKFAAIVPQQNDGCTRFLALDKCLPGRHFLQMLQIESTTESALNIEYDAEWLAILKKTDHLVNLKRDFVRLPTGESEKFLQCLPSDEDLEEVVESLHGCLTVPGAVDFSEYAYEKNGVQLNRQTDLFCDELRIQNWPMLMLDECGVLPPIDSSSNLVTSCEICLDDEDG